MVGVEEEERVLEEVVVFEEVEGVLCADEDCVGGGAHGLALLVEDLDGVDLLGPRLEHVVLDALVDLLLALARPLLQRRTQLLLPLQLPRTQPRVQLQLVLVEQHEHLGVGRDVEGRLRGDAVVLAGEVAQLVAQLRVLLVLEGSDVQDALERPLHEVVELRSQELRDLLQLALVAVDVLPRLQVLLHRVGPALQLTRALHLHLRPHRLPPLLGQLAALRLGPDGRRRWLMDDLLALIVVGVGLLVLAVPGVGAGEEFCALGLELLHLVLGAGGPFAEDLLVPGVLLLLELEVVDGVLGDEVVDGEHFLGDLEVGLQVEQVVGDVELCLCDVAVLVELEQFVEGLLEGGEAVGEQRVHAQLQRGEALQQLLLVPPALPRLKQPQQPLLLLLVLLLDLHVLQAPQHHLHLQLLTLLHNSI